MKKQMQKGFTLIELMIVVAIIGILAAIAIPQYQDYVTRAKWQDNIVSVESLKVAIADCTQNNAGVTTSCITFGQLGLSQLPTLTPANGVLTSVTAPTASTVSILITGTVATGNCTVTMLGTTGEANMTWGFTNGGGCTKRKTGVGT